ncbi:MAG TPA: hypothetical protein VJH65_00475 [Candidatus Nanoarchaeia archaeon]|nr:hypothetical protein [Candidatus Nanoarchaeia archaeon]
MAIFEQLLSILSGNSTILFPLIAFLAPIIGGGEIGVMTVAFFAVQVDYPLYSVIFFSFIGMILVDSFWFFLIRSKHIDKLKQLKNISEKQIKLEKHLENISGKHDMLILLFSKILVGTRILIIAYISLRKISFKKFFRYNTPPTFIWAICLSIIGWFAGNGYENIIQTTKDIRFAITFLIGVVLVFLIINYLLRKWIMQRKTKFI